MVRREPVNQGPYPDEASPPVLCPQGGHGGAGGREREVVRPGPRGGWRVASHPTGRAAVPRRGRQVSGPWAFETQRSRLERGRAGGGDRRARSFLRAGRAVW